MTTPPLMNDRHDHTSHILGGRVHVETAAKVVVALNMSVLAMTIVFTSHSNELHYALILGVFLVCGVVMARRLRSPWLLQPYFIYSLVQLGLCTVLLLLALSKITTALVDHASYINRLLIAAKLEEMDLRFIIFANEFTNAIMILLIAAGCVLVWFIPVLVIYIIWLAFQSLRYSFEHEN